MTNFCVCHSTHEGQPIVRCARCQQSFHARCLALDPAQLPAEVVCPLCLSRSALQRAVDAVLRSARAALASLPEPRGRFLSTEKHPFVVTVRVAELRRYIAAFLAPRPLARLAALPANSELRSARRKPVQDKTIRDFILTKLPLLAKQGPATLLLRGENLDALKLGALQHVASPREWFLFLCNVLQNSRLFLELALPNHAQSLPGEFVLLLEESLRLGIYARPAVLEILSQLCFITFCGLTHNLLLFPRDFEEWKRVQAVHREFQLPEDEPVFQFVQKVGIPAGWRVAADRAVRSVGAARGGADPLDDAVGGRQGTHRFVSQRVDQSAGPRAFGGKV